MDSKSVATLKDAHKNTKSAPRAKKPTEFFGDVKSEFHKIDWTSKDELRTYTKIVVGTTFALGLMIYGIDLTIQTILSGLSAFTQMIIG